MGKEARKQDTKEKTLIHPTPITLSLKPEYTSVQQILGHGRMPTEANVSIRVNDSYHQHTPFLRSVIEVFLLLSTRTEGATTLQRLRNSPPIAFNNPNSLCHLLVFLTHGLFCSQQLTARNKL